MDYYEVFRRRHNVGTKFPNAVNQEAVYDFEEFLRTSPNTGDVFIDDKEDSCKVGILSDRENNTNLTKWFLISNEIEAHIGSYFSWGSNIFLALRKKVETINAYQSFLALHCRHSIKWVDNFGVINELPCYLVSSEDQVIKGNFRTWNNMITPEPNKYIEVIVSNKDKFKSVKKGQKFIINEEAWYTVEHDFTSVQGVMYISLTEDKIDAYDDNIEESLANYKEANSWSIIAPTVINCKVGEELIINAEVKKEGNIVSKENYSLTSESELIEIEDKKVIVKENGIAEIKIFLKNQPQVYTTVSIDITDDAVENVAYRLSGDKSIKWGRTKTYYLEKITNNLADSDNCEFEIIDDNELVTYIVNNNILEVTANSKNKTGKIILFARNEEIELSKEIDIISIWM